MAASTINVKKRVAQKLRIIILLHFGLITFRIHFGKTPNPSFSCFSDLADVTMTPKTNIIYLWRHQDTPNNSRRIPNHFLNIIVGNVLPTRMKWIIHIQVLQQFIL